eukprot:9606512-Ditylum_brightwellii.AAC.1
MWKVKGVAARRRAMVAGAVVYESTICLDVKKDISQDPDRIGTWIDQNWGALIELYRINMVQTFCAKVLRKKGYRFWKNAREKRVMKQIFARKICTQAMP